jgi:hypothetical protein
MQDRIKYRSEWDIMRRPGRLQNEQRIAKRKWHSSRTEIVINSGWFAFGIRSDSRYQLDSTLNDSFDDFAMSRGPLRNASSVRVSLHSRTNYIISSNQQRIVLPLWNESVMRPYYGSS